jgi:energy-converting hydrogenase B subunit D
MNALMAVLLTLVAVSATVTVLTREPVRQAIMLGVMGLFLALLFFALQAPDVALSELVVGGIAIPVMLTLAIAKLRALDGPEEDAQDNGEGESSR